ncbi:MAG: hypothetical protein JJ992_02980 [Planctomycetes bacterium]|nr:hypothetical protein [Planctomycetota bacterium]
MAKKATAKDVEKKSLKATLLRPKVAIPLALIALLIIAPLFARSWFLADVPDFPEPFDVEPLLNDSIPDSENAFTDYRQALSLSVEPSPEVNALCDRIYAEGWQLANDHVRQFLDKNEKALGAWKKGTEKDKALYLPADEYGNKVSLDLLQELYEFQRVVVLLCRRLESEGKAKEAWEWYRAAIRASRHIGTRGIIAERVIGITSFLFVAENLMPWAADDKLTADDLRLAFADLQKDWELTEKNSTTLQIEYIWHSRMLDEILDQRSDEQQFIGYMKGEPVLTQRLIRFYYSNQLQFCDLPKYQRPKVAGKMRLFDDPAGFKINGFEWSEAAFDEARQRSPWFSFQRPDTNSLYESVDDEGVLHRALIVVLAGQAFRRDHGQFPKTLDELVPAYLEEVPLDNFDGKPLKYRFNPDGPVVYSVYKNLSDDGGQEWNWQTLAPLEPWPSDYGLRMQLPVPRPAAGPQP